MVENGKTNPVINGSTVQNANVKGELTYDDKVVQKIIGYALENVDGLLDIDGGFFSNLSQKIVESSDVTKGIDVEVGKKQVAVDLNVVIEYGKSIPQLFDKIKTVIKQRVSEMTGLDVIEVNVNVQDVKSKSQYEEDSVSLSEKASGAFGNATDKIKSVAGNTKDEVKEKVDNSRVE